MRMVFHAPRRCLTPIAVRGLKLGKPTRVIAPQRVWLPFTSSLPMTGVAGRQAGATDLTGASASLAAMTPFLLITATVVWEGFGESPWEPVGHLGVGRRGSMGRHTGLSARRFKRREEPH